MRTQIVGHLGQHLAVLSSQTDECSPTSSARREHSWTTGAILIASGRVPNISKARSLFTEGIYNVKWWQTTPGSTAATTHESRRVLE